MVAKSQRGRIADEPVDEPAAEPKLHPRDVTGRMPTFKDFSPEGQALGERQFAEKASDPHALALGAAAHAQSRVEGWRNKPKNAGKADNDYVTKELRRKEQMETVAGMVTPSETPITMDVAAERIADNYARAGGRTLRGDLALTRTELGPSSSGRHDLLSAENLAAGTGTVLPTGGAWYQEHGAHLNAVAAVYGADPRTTVVSSGSMSPMNSPSNERAAEEAITAATQKDRKVSLLQKSQLHDAATAAIRDKHPDPTTPQAQKAHAKALKTITTAHIGAQEALGMAPGDQRSFSSFTPEQVSEMPKHRSALGTGMDEVDYAGLAKGGTELQTGVRMARGELGQEDLGETGKVPSYVHYGLLGAGLESLGEAAPDANDVSEYNRRVHESIPGNKPYFEQDTLFGKDWEADPFGRAHVTQGLLNTGHQPDSPIPASASAAVHYPESTAAYEGKREAGEIELHEGSTAQDTWMMAQSLAMPREVEGAAVNNAVNPALVSKTLASDPHTVKFGSGDAYMPTPAGERKISASEVQHAVFNEVTNRAAGVVTQRARDAGRNVGAGVPVVAVQGGSWTDYRMEMDKDPDYAKRLSHLAQPTLPPTVPGKTPQPGADVPMFNDAGETLSYGKTWRPSTKKTKRGS